MADIKTESSTDVYDLAIPTLYFAKSISPVLGVIFSIILLCGIFSTAAPIFWTVADTFSKVLFKNDKFKTKKTVLQKKNKKKGKAGITKTEVIKTKMGYMIETRLLPFLNPGYFCYCDFSFLKGTKFIYKVQHTGNNYGVNCSTKIWVV